jgi:7-carboxy-7-deazaguanine synthase
VSTVRINEIFESIQGEGLDAGLPCAFVRLTACNLRCTYCDTAYAFYEGENSSLEEIIEVLHTMESQIVCITGGEPMLQPDVLTLMQRLLDRNYRVILETGGSLPLHDVPADVIKVMDIKTPGAFRGDIPAKEYAKSLDFLKSHLHYPNLKTLDPTDQVKFVLCDQDDYEWAKAFIAKYALSERVAAVHLSPIHPGLDPKELASWMIADSVPARLNLQLHKYIWGVDTRGV